MIVNDAIQLIDEEFPRSIRSHFVPTIKRAYELVEELKRDNDILNWPIGEDIIPYLRKVATEFEFMRRIKTGQLPLNYRIKKNVKMNCHHLEIVSNRSILTINQVRKAKHVPRKAEFRTNLSLSNQLLFDFAKDDYRIIDSPYYIILTHGYAGRLPEFVYLGVPQANVRQWIGRIDLLREPYQLDAPDGPKEQERIKLEFKEHVLEVIKNEKSNQEKGV